MANNPASDNRGDELLQALMREIVKVYRIYDGSNRVTTEYEAVANAVDQQVCLKTEYTYAGARTTPDKMRESLDVWSSAYDI
jgi:hypothetical protein